MFPKYPSIIDSVRGKTMLTEDRLNALYNVAQFCSELDGDFAELGCRFGGTSFLMALQLKSPHKLHAFDSFQGLPEPTINDYVGDKAGMNKGRVSSDEAEARAYLASQSQKIVVHSGWIQDTLENVKDCKFSLVYVDMDLYESTKFAIEFMWNRIVVGGYIVFDDYLWEATPGVTKVINEKFPNLFYYNHWFIHPQLGIQKR